MRIGVRNVAVSTLTVAAALALSACVRMEPPGGGTGTTTTTAPMTTTSSTAPSGGPIGPEQHFLGLVNGESSDAVIYVVCPGPAGGGRTGPPVADQSVAVHRVQEGGGNTGSLGNRVWSQFGPRQIAASFATYDSPVSLPTTLQLPCEGTGVVTFTTCFDTLPCTADAVDYAVKVTFVNLAV